MALSSVLLHTCGALEAHCFCVACLLCLSDDAQPPTSLNSTAFSGATMVWDGILLSLRPLQVSPSITVSTAVMLYDVADVPLRFVVSATFTATASLVLEVQTLALRFVAVTCVPCVVPDALGVWR